MTHSNDPEFMKCFITCNGCGEEYSLGPPDFTVREKQCGCKISLLAEAQALAEHFKVAEAGYSAQYQSQNGGRFQ